MNCDKQKSPQSRWPVSLRDSNSLLAEDELIALITSHDSRYNMRPFQP
jgi:hypothetical protein